MEKMGLESQVRHLVKKGKDLEALYLIFNAMSLRQKTEWGIFSAEQVIHLYKGKHQGPKKAIKAAKDCLKENFSEKSVLWAHMKGFSAKGLADINNDEIPEIQAALAAASVALNTNKDRLDKFPEVPSAVHALNTDPTLKTVLIKKGLEIIRPTSVQFILDLAKEEECL